MSRDVSPDPGAALRAVPRALLGTSLALLVLGAVFHQAGAAVRGPEAVSWIAVAWALLAPVVAVALRGEGLAPPPPSTGEEGGGDVAARLRRTLIFFAILESGVVLAAVALIVSPPVWPLAAALVPLAVMILNLPPRAGPAASPRRGGPRGSRPER